MDKLIEDFDIKPKEISVLSLVLQTTQNTAYVSLKIKSDNHPNG